jgi:hypothetical protein
MKGMTPINITVDDKENSHKRWFSAGVAVYNNKSYDSFAKISWVPSTEKLSDQFSISNIQLQMQLIKLPEKTKAHCNNKGNGELKDIYI